MDKAAATLAPEPVAPALFPAHPRCLAINFLYLSGGEFASKILSFAVFTWLARTLGPANFGFLEFTLAVMVFFTLPADLGLSSYGVREVARNPANASRLLHDITGLRLILALCSVLALGIFVLVLNKSLELKLLLAVYGASLLVGPFLTQWFFQAHDRMHWVGLASIARYAAFAGLVFLIYRRGLPLLRLGLIECAAVTATATFCIYVAHYKMGFPWPWPNLRIRHLLGHLKEAFPIGLNELAWAFMWYFSTVLLGFLFADRTVGWFGASHRVLMALNTFVYLYFFNLLPSISRCAALPHRDLLQLVDRSIQFSCWAGLFAAGFLTAAAPELLALIYGRAYRPAWASFAILVWMLPIAMLSGHHRYILIGYSQQRRLLACTACSALAAVLLAFALIPSYGGPGAAWALLIANAINLVLVYVSVRQLVIEVPIHRQLAAPLITLAVSALVYLALAQRSVWGALAGGSAVYAAGLVSLSGRQLVAFLHRPTPTAAAQ